MLAPPLALLGCATAGEALVDYRIERDAIPQPLTAAAPDPARGREIVVGRDGNCLLCHALPETGARFMGNLAPPLSRLGARLSAGQLRLRLVDSMRLNPDTIMPSYYRVDGLNQVAPAFRGKPILTAQQIEDTIAYLETLR
jgi:L-cysteine S-thiosulfotransferase